ncbi:unnamed protein product [Choristocarpus tenellus]
MTTSLPPLHDAEHDEEIVEVDLKVTEDKTIKNDKASRPGFLHPVPHNGMCCERCLQPRMIRLILRTANMLFALLAFFAAPLLYNGQDRHKALWGVIYFVGALLCVLSELNWGSLRKYVVVPGLWLFFGITLAGSLYILLVQLIIQAKRFHGKEANEFMHLALLWVWMAVVILLDRFKVVGLFGKYSTLRQEQSRDKEGHVQMGEVVL